MNKIDLTKYWLDGKMPHDAIPIYSADEIRIKIGERAKKYGWGHTSLVPATWRLSIDEDKWCAVLGPNSQEGWVAFGETQSEAVLDLYKEMLGEHL